MPKISLWFCAYGELGNSPFSPEVNDSSSSGHRVLDTGYMVLRGVGLPALVHPIWVTAWLGWASSRADLGPCIVSIKTARIQPCEVSHSTQVDAPRLPCSTP